MSMYLLPSGGPYFGGGSRLVSFKEKESVLSPEDQDFAAACSMRLRGAPVFKQCWRLEKAQLSPVSTLGKTKDRMQVNIR